MTSVTSREIHLRSRPHGLPTADNFALVSVEVPTPSHPDQVLVRNQFISVDPYMRGRMRDTRSYTPPFGLDEPLTGGAVGEVVSSTSDQFAEGDFVLHMFGWREYALAEPRHLTKVDPSLAPLQSYLGVLGMPGMTAYVGLLDIGKPQPGETVFVSGAAGAVGSEVCQIAKIQGCRVVGSTGSQVKARVGWRRSPVWMWRSITRRQAISGASSRRHARTVSTSISRMSGACIWRRLSSI